MKNYIVIFLMFLTGCFGTKIKEPFDGAESLVEMPEEAQVEQITKLQPQEQFNLYFYMLRRTKPPLGTFVFRDLPGDNTALKGIVLQELRKSNDGSRVFYLLSLLDMLLDDSFVPNRPKLSSMESDVVGSKIPLVHEIVREEMSNSFKRHFR